MQNSFWIDMALSILFAVLREKGQLMRYERAFRKLYDSIGMAFGWGMGEAGPSDQPTLPGA